MLKPKPAMHIMGEKDPLVKPEWQKMMYTAVLKLDNCNKEGQKYDTLSTLYASTTGNPVVLFIHPGGHAYPLEANAVVIKFFKSQAKQ
jgi:polyhydroxybutyrate depolymerase